MESSVTIHDRYQIELKIGYLLPLENKKTNYQLDMYIFAPGALGVTPETYPHHQFYTDLQANIRLKTPVVPISQLIDGKASPLHKLRHIFKAMAKNPQGNIPDSYENQIKLCGCIFKSAIRNFALFIDNTPNTEDRRRLVTLYCSNIKEIAAKYRELLPIIQVPGITQRTLDYYHFGDEYLSLVIEEYSCHLAELLTNGNNDSFSEETAMLRAVVLDELNYRKSRGYPSIAEEQGDNETLVFRKSVLKKYIASILFLNTEIRREGMLLEQTLFGLAAAVAMIFATSVTFISQSLFGALTLPVFIAVVISYIFKDRLKDLLRYYLSRKIARFIYDKKTKIYDAAKNTVGFCRESFECIDDHKLPRDIPQIRNRDHITEIENGWVGEQVLLYRKRVFLYPAKVQQIFSNYQVGGINDIIRFNIQEFLRRMDDPKKELFIMDDDAFLPVKGSRVYHLNLVIKLAHGEKSTLTRYRVVMTRKGIKRIEPVCIE